MKKRLLFITPSLRVAGAEKVLLTILKNLDHCFYQVDLCLIYKLGDLIGEVPDNVRLIYLFKSYEKYVRKIQILFYKYLHINMFEYLIVRRKVTKRYDITISFLEGASLKYHSLIFKRAKRNITWVHTNFTDNHYTINNLFSKRDEIIAYSRMDAIVFVSNDIMMHFNKVFNIDCEKVVIHNPIDIELIKKESLKNIIPKRKFTICSVGSLISIKRFDKVLKVARLLKNENYDLDFWIVGDGGLKESLIRERDELDLKDTVHFLGLYNPAYPCMKSSDIFLMTSRAEGLPMVICEAMCLGLPIVSTNCTGARELLGFGEFGVLTEENIESIAFGLKSLIENPNILMKYKVLSLKRSEMFDVGKSMTEIVGVIEKP